MPTRNIISEKRLTSTNIDKSYSAYVSILLCGYKLTVETGDSEDTVESVREK